MALVMLMALMALLTLVRLVMLVTPRSRTPDSPHLGRRRHARILESRVEELGLDPADYGTHSMRRTQATLIYRRTNKLRAVQWLLGHSKLEPTVRCLGIEVDDALEIPEQTEI